MKQFGDFVEVNVDQYGHMWISAKHVVLVRQSGELDRCDVMCDDGSYYDVMMSAPAFLNKLDQAINNKKA